MASLLDAQQSMEKRATEPAERAKAASAGRKMKLANGAKAAATKAITFEAVEAAPSLNTGGAALATN
jgi:hypothetical protein